MLYAQGTCFLLSSPSIIFLSGTSNLAPPIKWDNMPSINSCLRYSKVTRPLFSSFFPDSNFLIFIAMFFKIFFYLKYIKIIFFKKFIFNTSISKQFKNIHTKLFFKKIHFRTISIEMPLSAYN
jgi:hypothetical protein